MQRIPQFANIPEIQRPKNAPKFIPRRYTERVNYIFYLDLMARLRPLLTYQYIFKSLWKNVNLYVD